MPRRNATVQRRDLIRLSSENPCSMTTSASVYGTGVRVLTPSNSGNDAQALDPITSEGTDTGTTCSPPLEMAPVNPRASIRPLTMTKSLMPPQLNRPILSEHRNGSVGNLQLSVRFSDDVDDGNHEEEEDEESEDVDEESGMTPEDDSEEKTRAMLALRLKALKDRFPGRSQLELEAMAEISYLKELPKNQSYYRIMAMRHMTGEGDIISLDRIRSKLVNFKRCQKYKLKYTI